MFIDFLLLTVIYNLKPDMQHNSETKVAFVHGYNAKPIDVIAVVFITRIQNICQFRLGLKYQLQLISTSRQVKNYILLQLKVIKSYKSSCQLVEVESSAKCSFKCFHHSQSKQLLNVF